MSNEEINLSMSLCTGSCRHDPDHGYCLRCYRTKAEVALWRRMTPQEREVVVGRIRARKASETTESTDAE